MENGKWKMEILNHRRNYHEAVAPRPDLAV
jgi:hypothetical protein